MSVRTKKTNKRSIDKSNYEATTCSTDHAPYKSIINTQTCTSTSPNKNTMKQHTVNTKMILNNNVTHPRREEKKTKI